MPWKMLGRVDRRFGDGSWIFIWGEGSMKWRSLIRYALGLAVILCSFIMANPVALVDPAPSCPSDMRLIEGRS